jgi:hypothetical protein
MGAKNYRGLQNIANGIVVSLANDNLSHYYYCIHS